MAIRIRKVDGITIAICAARSVKKEGDIYLDDHLHKVLGEKFARDFNSMFDCGLSGGDADVLRLVEQEESNNPARDAWDAWQAELEEQAKRYARSSDRRHITEKPTKIGITGRAVRPTFTLPDNEADLHYGDD